ncbi:hypothetical protein DN402_33270 [Streptomyces sp. SW4]|nr:hypothetical protein DN402_33270 [Streptomyces sp. SW4]
MVVVLAVANALIVLCVLVMSSRGRSGGKRAVAAALWTAGMVLLVVSDDPPTLTMGATALLAGLLFLAELVAGRTTCFVSLLWIVAGGALLWLREGVGERLADTDTKIGALVVVAVLTLSMTLGLREQRRMDRDPYGGAPGV